MPSQCGQGHLYLSPLASNDCPLWLSDAVLVAWPVTVLRRLSRKSWRRCRRFERSHFIFRTKQSKTVLFRVKLYISVTDWPWMLRRHDTSKRRKVLGSRRGSLESSHFKMCKAEASCSSLKNVTIAWHLQIVSRCAVIRFVRLLSLAALDRYCE
jgi:hypothetical protein